MDKIKAVIFDMDGVISDTESIHAGVESELLKEYGINIPANEITKNYAGLSDKEFLPKIFAINGKPMPDFSQFVEEKWERIKNAAIGNVKEIQGTKAFIDLIKARGLPIAVASASRMFFIEIVLSEIGVKDKFDVILSADEVANGKPAPDVFLLAAERLGVLPQNCLVIEDGMNGMIAAKRAGMQCIGLVQPNDKGDYPADLLVDDLRNVPMDKFF